MSCPMQTSHFSLLTSHFSLLTFRFSLFASHFFLPATPPIRSTPPIIAAIIHQ